MRRNGILVLPIIVFLALTANAHIKIVPTTTLSAQTSNNTSTANSFRSQKNGNLGATNVSKVDVRSLLYPSSSTKIYAHLLVWFGGSNHMNVGYASDDAQQVHRQVNDMISRGISGVIIDWYGPGNREDNATKLIMAEAEKHSGFTFGIMVDKGAIPQAGCGSCSPQDALTSELQYISQHYFSSPAYMRVNGQPMVTNFDIDLHYSIDWNALKGKIPGDPIYVFQHADGFTHTLSDGSYSWVILSDDYGMSYLTGFYDAGLAHPSLDTIGATYKGFNDSLAGWGSGRVMSQQCGQTWLKTFNKINGMYNSGKQLDSLQLVTWNDYEEGTELESGIDNCASISASLSGKSLSWKFKGNENTVDHYTVYISTDGKNLMSLQEVGVGTHTLNLGSFDLGSGAYTMYVQAVGQPTIVNHMSGSVKYQVSGGAESGGSGGGDNSASMTLGATPTSVNLKRGQSASVRVTVSTNSGTINNDVALACSNLPAGVTCSFSPDTVKPGASSATTTLTISTQNMASKGGMRAMYAMFLPGFGFAGLFVMEQRRQLKRALLVVLGSVLLLVLCSCGGGGMASQSTSASSPSGTSATYLVSVNGVSGSIQNSTTVTLQIR